MASFTINQYQCFTFSYINALPDLHILDVPDNIGLTNNFDGTYNFEVDVANVLGITNYTVLDGFDVPVDTITLTVIEVIPSEVHNLCLADINLLYPLPVPPSGIWQYTDDWNPSWTVLLPFGNGILGVLIAGQTGTFNFLFQTSTDPLNEVYLIQINIQSCLPEYNFCSPYRAPIVWLNQAGGWSTYCFKGRKTLGVTIGESRQFKTTQRVQKHYSRTNVYDTLAILSGEIPIGHAAFIKSLKYSIQAYLITTIGYIPIFIDEKDFDLYEEGNGLMSYNVSLKIATEINIQSQ